MRTKTLLKCAAMMLCFAAHSACSTAQPAHNSPADILPGAYVLDEYLPLLKGKKVALFVNQTSRIEDRLLPDTLLKCGIHVVKIFVPEHGFRGLADAGAHVKNDVDAQTGLPVISLYGKNKKPQKEQLHDVDVVVYDLQDVGVRFYTYISSLQYMMEACIENGKQLIVLDRPNPNGHYVDGFVLEKEHTSFVGMQSVPVVYGMTVGEYAAMLVGEGWIDDAEKLNLKIIACKNYDHTKRYHLPVAPSPNLKTMAAVYLYPSLCFFEGTVISMGRGTNKPFQQWGHPKFGGKSDFYFVPKSRAGAGKPLYENQKCFGRLIATNADTAYNLVNGKLHLDAMIEAYKWFPEKDKFFNNFLVKLAGTDELQDMIEQGMTAEEIRNSWQNDVVAFKKIRRKYLLYKDFE